KGDANFSHPWRTNFRGKVMRHITLILIRLDPIKRKGGIKARRLIAANSDLHRAPLLGLA
ncbi:MAG TPA: hypothetical protein PLS67_06425, partial [Accumulibacter sp.]|nr:hypothetical protein [Accumulibacter sp.]